MNSASSVTCYGKIRKVLLFILALMIFSEQSFSFARNANSDFQHSPAFHTSKQTNSSPLSPKSTRLPLHRSSSFGTLAMGISHSSSLSSLGEITASERGSSKLQTGSRRLLFQVSYVINCLGEIRMFSVFYRLLES